MGEETEIKLGKNSRISLIKKGARKGAGKGFEQLIKKTHFQQRNFENEKAIYKLTKENFHPCICTCYDIRADAKVLLLKFYVQGNLQVGSNNSVICSSTKLLSNQI